MAFFGILGFVFYAVELVAVQFTSRSDSFRESLSRIPHFIANSVKVFRLIPKYPAKVLCPANLLYVSFSHLYSYFTTVLTLSSSLAFLIKRLSLVEPQSTSKHLAFTKSVSDTIFLNNDFAIDQGSGGGGYGFNGGGTG